MRKDTDHPSDRPALVVTYGNTTQRYRPLEGDLVVLGRARTSDIALVSPEVATVHCILARVGGGWRLRDCTGRGGTRLNGAAVSDVPLNNGDLLQVGTFSFEVKLPPAGKVEARAPQRSDDATTLRLQRSRRNLAHLGLELRRRLREERAALRPQEEVDRQADRLRALQRDWEARRKQQEQADAAARAQREAAERELAGRREQLERAEQEAGQRHAEAESVQQAQRQELEQMRLQAEASHQRRLQELRQVCTSGVAPDKALGELERAGRRLARFAGKLRRNHQRLQQQACELASEHARLGRPSPEAGPDPGVEQLRTQVEELQEQLAEAQAQAEVQEKELTALRALEDAQSAFVELSGGAHMHELIASLRQQVKDRDALLEKMNQKLGEHTARPDADDMAGYEAELNQYRIELERDRRQLNEQMAQVQQRHQDMEEALREAELQMARERAQLAREQAELNRLRMELSRASNRRSREVATRKRLAEVDRLKQDVTDKSNSGEGEPANGAGRIRSLLNRLTGSSA
jgi:hypothetical protein